MIRVRIHTCQHTMPHLVILYTGQLDQATDMKALCRKLADTMLVQRDDKDQAVFPIGGTRVLAYPAPHYAVADDGAAGRAAGGTGDYAFVYLNLRMSRGRSAATHQRVGEALLATTQAHFQPVFEQSPIGITLQIDAGTEVFDGKYNNLHPLFKK
jgi:5-carboxymethyl-2-hydroxymuconate isomerase